MNKKTRCAIFPQVRTSDSPKQEWGQESYTFLPKFLEVTRENYDAELAELDFAESDRARHTINRWVQTQTEDKIADLVPSGVLTSDTRLVLTNAVYFHGMWSEPFQKARTKDEDFFLTATDTVQVPMMHSWDKFRYRGIEDLQVLELPYGDGSLSMLILLPNEIDGLADLETKLTIQNLARWTTTIECTEKVIVSLPKFKTASQFELTSTLEAMGMTTAFDATTADFADMTGGRDLFVSAVIHKAFVEVNEEGTEAAAATGVVVTKRSAPIQKPKIFRADHPFVFMIRDNRTGSLLFIGRTTNPLK